MPPGLRLRLVGTLFRWTETCEVAKMTTFETQFLACIAICVAYLKEGRHQFEREGQVLTQVFNACSGGAVVVPLPVKHFCYVTFGSKTLHECQNLEVRQVQFVRVLLGVLILLHNQNSLLEEVTVNLDTPLLYDKLI